MCLCVYLFPCKQDSWKSYTYDVMLVKTHTKVFLCTFVHYISSTFTKGIIVRMWHTNVLLESFKSHNKRPVYWKDIQLHLFGWCHRQDMVSRLPSMRRLVVTVSGVDGAAVFRRRIDIMATMMDLLVPSNRQHNEGWYIAYTKQPNWGDWAVMWVCYSMSLLVPVTLH